MLRMKAYLLLGSNIEPRLVFLAKAATLIEKRIGALKQCSALYETKAWGKEDQADFLNQALCVETNLQPQKLLEIVKIIEKEVGRKARSKWNEREIDIDILLIDNIIFSTASLEIPHPYLHERNFALQPLVEIAADIIHPIFKKTINELIAACEDDKPVQLFKK